MKYTTTTSFFSHPFHLPVDAQLIISRTAMYRSLIQLFHQPRSDSRRWWIERVAFINSLRYEMTYEEGCWNAPVSTEVKYGSTVIDSLLIVPVTKGNLQCVNKQLHGPSKVRSLYNLNL